MLKQQQPTMQQPVAPPYRGVQRLFLIALAVVIVLATGFCVIIIGSLLPYFPFIGKMAVVVVGVLLFCIAVQLLAYTWFRLGSWANKRNLLVAGDVVILLDNKGRMIEHLSALHERAKVPQLLPPPSDDEETVEEFPMSDEDIVDLYNHGSSERTIAEAAGMSRYQVRKVLDRQKPEKTSKKKDG